LKPVLYDEAAQSERRRGAVRERAQENEQKNRREAKQQEPQEEGARRRRRRRWRWQRRPKIQERRHGVDRAQGGAPGGSGERGDAD